MATQTLHRGTHADSQDTNIAGLREAVQLIDHLSQDGLSEISAIAKLALNQLEHPDGYKHPELIARALIAISCRADELENSVNSAAEQVGCDFVDDALERRSDARRKLGPLMHKAIATDALSQQATHCVRQEDTHGNVGRAKTHAALVRRPATLKTDHEIQEILSMLLESIAMVRCSLERLNSDVAAGALKLMDLSAEQLEKEIALGLGGDIEQASGPMCIALAVLHVAVDQTDSLAIWGAIRLLTDAKDRLGAMCPTQQSRKEAAHV